MDEICRLCSSTKFVNNNIFDEKNALFIKMSLYLPIKIQKGDRLPQRICDRCSCKVNDLYQFCNEAIEVQNKFKAILSYDKETDTSIDLTLIKRDTYSPLPRCDDKEADTSIDVTLIKSDTDSPLLRCDKSTQTSEPTTNLPEVKITEEPKQTVPAPIKEELPDDDYMPVLPSDSDDEVLSKIQSRRYLTSQNVKEQENGIENNHRKTNKKSKVNKKKKVPAKVLTENDVNVLQEDNRVRPQDPNVDIDSLGDNSRGAHFCCICFKSFTDYNKADMLRHYKTHVNRAVLRIRTPRAPPLPAEKPFRCQRCRKTVLKAKYWGAHWRHHWKQDRRLYHCGMCDLTFRNENNIFIHGKTHKPGEERKEQPKPYMCDSCPETFQLPGCLLAHRTRAHFETAAQQMFLRCSTCKRSFTHLASLERHQRVHTGERKYRCKVCGKALTSREILKNHMRIHTGQKPFICGECGMRFIDKGNLKKHMRVHTGEKPYECSHCGKAFSQSSALNVHKRYHTGEQPYKCEQCGRSYVARALLTVHLRTCTDQAPPKKNKRRQLFRVQMMCHQRKHFMRKQRFQKKPEVPGHSIMIITE